jgi:tricarballylate dehydrogenase
MQQPIDVIVVGKGNAALCAALEARHAGARVVMLEAAPEDESGGNSRFAGGMMRFTYNGVEDLRTLLEITDEEARNTDWDTNTVDEFYDDLYKVTNYRTDPRLSELLITRSLESMQWLRKQGVRFVLNYRAASAVVDGRRRFFGGMAVEVSGGGPGLVQFLDQASRPALTFTTTRVPSRWCTTAKRSPASTPSATAGCCNIMRPR